MLNFKGYIPKRRGIIEHLYDGRLTPMEYILFDILMLWADHRSGIATTNGPGIVYLSGEQLKLDTVQKCLASLEAKGYIKRPFYLQGQRGNQKIFIDKFLVTDGVLKNKVLSFADTKDWHHPAYISATEGPTDNPTDGATDNAGVSPGVSAASNNNQESRIENEEVDDNHQPHSESETDTADFNSHRENLQGLMEGLELYLGVSGSSDDLKRLGTWRPEYILDAARWASTHPYWKQLSGKHVSHFVRACLKERGLLDQFEEARKNGKVISAAAAEPAPAPQREHAEGCSHFCRAIGERGSMNCPCWCHEPEPDPNDVGSPFEIVED